MSPLIDACESRPCHRKSNHGYHHELRSKSLSWQFATLLFPKPLVFTSLSWRWTNLSTLRRWQRIQGLKSAIEMAHPQRTKKAHHDGWSLMVKATTSLRILPKGWYCMLSMCEQFSCLSAETRRIRRC